MNIIAILALTTVVNNINPNIDVIETEQKINDSYYINMIDDKYIENPKDSMTIARLSDIG